jgi:hypothetical protein
MPVQQQGTPHSAQVRQLVATAAAASPALPLLLPLTVQRLEIGPVCMLPSVL